MKSLKKTILTVTAVLSLVILNAQESNKNEFRAFYGLSSGNSPIDMFSKTLVNGIFGKSRTESSSFGMAGIGYRYNIDKFSLGIDLGYSSTKDEYFKDQNSKTPEESYKTDNYLVLPTASYSYFKKGMFDLYGSASAGMNFGSRKQDDVKNAKTEHEQEFAYQINPIGVRFGGENVGAFLEAGYGHKGIVSAGINFKF